MAGPAKAGENSWRIVLLNKRSLLSAILLVFVLLVISSNSFWRWMYPISFQTPIQQAAKVNHVNPLLVASVIRVESKFRTEDVSHAGAIGLMQLMPDTANWIALQMDTADIHNFNGSRISGSDLAEPNNNILIGSYYIRYLIVKFNGNEVAAVAAYNGGPQRVQTWLSSGVWNGQLSTMNAIPVGETRHFVDRVFYNYDLYHRIYGNDKAWKSFD